MVVADAPEAWAALGFDVRAGTCVVGQVRIRLAGTNAVRGLTSWSLREIAGTELDGLPTERSERQLGLTSPFFANRARKDKVSVPSGESPAHPNGIAAIDHVVAITPALERTVAALRGAGLDLRRIREEPTQAGAPRQAFFRLGETILEVVQEPAEVVEREGADRPAFFWGLALLASDLERTVAGLGDRVGEIRPAVQPGRRIATLRRSAGLALPVALITPSDGLGS